MSAFDKKAWMREYLKEYRSKPENRDRQRAKLNSFRANVRAQIITKLGGACACCGETEPEFLHIDHINGGGTAHRSKSGSDNYYKGILYDPDILTKYRILCANCNGAFAKLGYCPHHPPEVVP